MLIDLKKTKYYYLTTRTNAKRVKHIEGILKIYDLTEVNPIMGENFGKQRSGCTGTARMVDLGLRNQKKNEPFQPFILLEDDVSLSETMPDKIEIPDDADIIYIGVSCGGLGKHTRQKPGDPLYATDYNEKYIRVYNMLSTHAIMICSAAGANIYAQCMLEGFYNPTGWDCYLARIQSYYKVYALKNPLFYQDAEYGGVEYSTNINFASGNIIYHSKEENQYPWLPTKYITPPELYRPLITSLCFSQHPKLNLIFRENRINFEN
jgi:hypothetical protein